MSSIMREDWIECNLDEVCFYSKGKKPPVLANSLSENNNVPYINIKAFEKGIIDEYTNGDKCNLCEDGDLLMVWDGARAGLTGKAKKGAVGSTLMKIEEVNGLEKEYLHYYLLSLFTKINTNPRGVGIPHVEPRILWLSKILIVSSPIQRAIVSKIEALFSDLDNGIANFKKAQEQLKIYRQAVLKKAFEGELTKEWREKQTHLPTAEDLLQQIKQERQNHYNQQIEDWKKAVKDWEKNGKVGKKPSKPTAQKELPAFTNDELEELAELPRGWSWCKNENYLFEVKDGTHDTPKYLSDGIPFITQKNIKNNSIDFSNVTFISESDHEKFYKRSNVENGDIIIAMIGHGRGNSCLVKTDKIFSIKNVGLFKFFKNIQSNKFSLNYYQSTLGLNLILKSSKGGAQPFIGLTELRNWAVPVCSLQEQTAIVQEIESRLSVCDKMEQSINESIEKAEALRQSILKKAFEGKLLSQAEIEQCKQAADYEPASELLKKIQAEKLATLRQAQDAKKKKPTVKKKIPKG